VSVAPLLEEALVLDEFELPVREVPDFPVEDPVFLELPEVEDAELLRLFFPLHLHFSPGASS
jgi:hypothetical protein